MRVHIGSIRKTRGATLNVAFAKELSSPWEQGSAATLPVEVRAEVTNGGRYFLVHGEVRASLDVPCDRCLKEVHLALEFDFEEQFCPRDRVRPAAEIADEDDFQERDPLSEDEANLFDGDVFYLDDVVREHLLLALPAKVVCSEACRGLCPECGKDRNDEACTCEPQAIDPRLAALAELIEPKRDLT